jgi:hypothetical protein
VANGVSKGILAMAQIKQEDKIFEARVAPGALISLAARLIKRLPDWLTHWEVWLALLVGGWLRLFHLDRALWLGDQTELLDMARTAIQRGLIPATGIPSSIGALNPPLSIYLLLPIAFFTANPLSQTIALALWNVAGVAICYVAALCGFGRRVAAWSALFFAVCPASVWYSRYLWQQNFIAPLLGLWALTLFAALVGNGRRWFVAHVGLLALCVLLHPTALLLAPVTLATLWLAPRRPRPLEYALAGVVVLLLLIPTLLWEVASGWSDLAIFGRFSARGVRYDAQVASALFSALGAPFTQSLGTRTGTAYAALVPIFYVLASLTLLLFALGWLGLTRRLWLGLRAAWRSLAPGDATWRDRVGRWRSVARGVKANERWRLTFALWLWVTLPPLAMIRRTTAIYPHYLIVLYPGVFLVMGLGVVWLLRWRIWPARADDVSQTGLRPGTLPQVWLRAAPVVLVSAFLCGLTLQSTLYTTSVDSSRYSATAGYGDPLNSMLGAVDELNAIQRRERVAHVDIIATLKANYHGDLAALLVDGRPERSAMDGACLRLPGAGASLVVAEQTSLPASRLLATLPNVTKVGALPVHGDEPALVYRVKPLTGALPGETAAGAVMFGGANQPALRLEGEQRVAPNLLLLRWTVLTSAVSTHPVLTYHVRVTSGTSDAASMQGETTCGATQWSAGDTLYTWIHLKSTGDARTLGLRAMAERVDYPTFRAAGLMWFAGARGSVSSTLLTPPGGSYTLPRA